MQKYGSGSEWPKPCGRPASSPSGRRAFFFAPLHPQCQSTDGIMSALDRAHEHRTAQDLVIVTLILVAAICCRNYFLASNELSSDEKQQQVEYGER